MFPFFWKGGSGSQRVDLVGSELRSAAPHDFEALLVPQVVPVVPWGNIKPKWSPMFAHMRLDFLISSPKKGSGMAGCLAVDNFFSWESMASHGLDWIAFPSPKRNAFCSWICVFLWVKPPPFKHPIWLWPFPKGYKNMRKAYFPALATSPSQQKLLLGKVGEHNSSNHGFMVLITNLVTEANLNQLTSLGGLTFYEKWWLSKDFMGFFMIFTSIGFVSPL